MMNKGFSTILTIIGAAILLIGVSVGGYLYPRQNDKVGAPTNSVRLERSLNPETTDKWELGTTTKRWLNSFVKNASTTVLSAADGSSSTTISSTATSTFATGIQATLLNITSSSATSTFANGIQLSGGCFRGTNGSCVGGVGVSIDWQKEDNFGVLNLTASTTIPYWAKDAIYASSTLIVNGNTTLYQATTTQLYATSTIGLNSEYFTDFTGTGLQNTAGALTLNATGDWTGTLDGYNGTDFLLVGNTDWKKELNYGVLNLTASTTIPYWAKDALYASSSLIVAGNTTLGYSTSTSLYATSTLGLNSEYFTDLTGTGLQNTAGALTLNATGDWTGTIDSNNFAGGAIGVGELLYGSGAGTIAERAVGTAGQVLMMSDGLPIWAATSTPTAAYAFTPTSHFGSIVSATTTSLFASGAAGLYASSSSFLSTTTISGNLNTGLLTATSGTSYLNALSLGTDLSVANGGSGAGTFTSGGLLIGQGTSAFAVTNAGASSTVLTTDGTTPRFNTGLTLSNLIVTASTTLEGSLMAKVATTSDLYVSGVFAIPWASTTGPGTYHSIIWGGATTSQARFVLSGNTSIEMNSTSSKPVDGGHYITKFCQDATGSRTLTWINPVGIRWWRGTTTISSTANSCSYIGWIYDDLYDRYVAVASSTGVLER